MIHTKDILSRVADLDIISLKVTQIYKPSKAAEEGVSISQFDEITLIQVKSLFRYFPTGFPKCCQSLTDGNRYEEK